MQHTIGNENENEYGSCDLTVFSFGHGSTVYVSVSHKAKPLAGLNQRKRTVVGRSWHEKKDLIKGLKEIIAQLESEPN